MEKFLLKRIQAPRPDIPADFPPKNGSFCLFLASFPSFPSSRLFPGIESWQIRDLLRSFPVSVPWERGIPWDAEWRDPDQLPGVAHGIRQRRARGGAFREFFGMLAAGKASYPGHHIPLLLDGFELLRSGRNSDPTPFSGWFCVCQCLQGHSQVFRGFSTLSQVSDWDLQVEFGPFLKFPGFLWGFSRKKAPVGFRTRRSCSQMDFELENVGFSWD